MIPRMNLISVSDRFVMPADIAVGDAIVVHVWQQPDKAAPTVQNVLLDGSILGFQFYDPPAVVCDTSHGRIMIRVGDGEIQCFYERHSHFEKLWVLIRVRPGAKRYVSDYPSSCPRCGRSAYVGLFEVVHRESQDSCPAGR